MPYKSLWRKAYSRDLTEESFVAAMKELRRRKAIRIVTHSTADLANPDVELTPTGEGMILKYGFRTIPKGVTDHGKPDAERTPVGDGK